MTIKAKNDCVLVIRDIPESEKLGIKIPDAAKKASNTAIVVSVGSKVEDKSIKEGMRIAFNRTSGFELEIEDIIYTILRGHEIVCSL